MQGVGLQTRYHLQRRSKGMVRQCYSDSAVAGARSGTARGGATAVALNCRRGQTLHAGAKRLDCYRTLPSARNQSLQGLVDSASLRLTSYDRSSADNWLELA